MQGGRDRGDLLGQQQFQPLALTEAQIGQIELERRHVGQFPQHGRLGTAGDAGVPGRRRVAPIHLGLEQFGVGNLFRELGLQRSEVLVGLGLPPDPLQPAPQGG